MMNNKQFAIHTFCLLLFIAGCGVFWLVNVNVNVNENEDENQNVCQVTENKNNYITSEGKGKDTSHNTSMKVDGAAADSGRISPFTSKHSNKAVPMTDSCQSREKQDVSESEDIEETSENVVENVGFNHFGGEDKALKDNDLFAIIHESQKLDFETPVKLRLLDEVIVDGVRIPKNTLVYAKAISAGERISMKIETITYNNKEYSFDANVYDLEGEEGITIKKLADRKQKNVKVTLPSGYKLKIKKR